VVDVCAASQRITCDRPCAFWDRFNDLFVGFSAAVVKVFQAEQASYPLAQFLFAGLRLVGARSAIGGHGILATVLSAWQQPFVLASPIWGRFRNLFNGVSKWHVWADGLGEAL